MFAEKISFYKLIKKIGAGGMGEVYLAEDTRLNRKVALKILPEDVARDRKRLGRFLQEASLAANLSHPNICIIYEVNDSEEVPFIAMEYLEGETLAGKIQNGDLELDEIIDYAAQMADALDEAHQQGIIHRDIKSANIIINRRGLIKILDFGLAKTIVENVSEEAVTQAKTEAGVLVGTVQYMSPEHAIGKNLDGRSDLWSLGVLLYEMAAGESPFKGQTQVAIFDSILHSEPVPPTRLNKNIPPELEKIILKLLEKERDFRYQTASDLHADLRRLQRQSRDLIKLERSDGTFSFEKTDLPKTEFITNQTDELTVGKTSDQVREPKSPRRRYLWGILVLILAICGISIGIYRYLSVEETFFSAEKRENQRLTNLGDVRDAKISADGKYLVYVQDDGLVQNLWLKQIATGSVVQITPPANVIYQGVDISPDGTWIYYNIWDKKGVGEIFRVPVLGGIQQMIVHDVMPGVGISPDNQKIAFIRSYDTEKENRLIVADIDGKNEETIAKRGQADGFISNFVWSPDGTTLAALSTQKDANGELQPGISEVSITEKSESLIWIIPEKLQNFTGGLIWQPDKKGLLITLAEQRNPYGQIWQISYPSGEAKQLTKDLNAYSRLSITADGKNMTSIQVDSFASLWVVPTDNPANAQKITNGKVEGLGVNWTPDDKLLYGSTIGGNVDIWMSDPDGSNKKQLTSDPNYDSEACVSPDLRKIYFTSNRNNGISNLWTMNLDGSNQTPLLQSDSQWNVLCSKNENFIYYYGFADNKNGIYQISYDGGEPRRILDKQSFRVSISPDEKYLAYSVWDETKKELVQEVFTVATGEIRRIELPSTAVGEGQEEPSFKWTPDGKNFSFINSEKNTHNIWIQPVSGGKPSRVTDFKESFIHSYSWSFDGKKLAVMRGNQTRDVILMTVKN